MGIYHTPVRVPYQYPPRTNLPLRRGPTIELKHPLLHPKQFLINANTCLGHLQLNILVGHHRSIHPRQWIMPVQHQGFSLGS